MVTACHHIALWVSDLAKAKAFYVDALGFAVAGEHARPERGDTVAHLRLGDMVLELFAGAGHPPRASYPEALGLRHIAFQVSDIDMAVKTLAAQGIAAEPIRNDTFTGERMTFIFDPDGQPIELHA